MYIGGSFFENFGTMVQKGKMMNIEILSNITFYGVLFAFIAILAGCVIRDCGGCSGLSKGLKVFGRIVVGIAIGFLLWKLLSGLGNVPGIVGFTIGFLLGITGLILTLLVWLLKKLKKLLSKMWKAIPWWGKALLILAIIVLAIFVFASICG